MTSLIEAGAKGKDRVEITAAELALLSRNARRLERLSSDILDVTRIESGALQLSKENVDLAGLVSDAVEDAKEQVMARATIITTNGGNTNNDGP